jgi:hypothetical protein
MTYRIEKPINWASLQKAEAELQRYYQSFPCRSAAVRRETERMLEELRARPLPPPQPVPSRLRLGEYEHPDTGAAMLDGLLHPGL